MPPPSTPSADLRCHRLDGKGWHCKGQRLQDKGYCQKHYFEYRSKREEKKMKESNGVKKNGHEKKFKRFDKVGKQNLKKKKIDLDVGGTKGLKKNGVEVKNIIEVSDLMEASLC
ncbi:hypothetical protein FRX31_006572 [Thalictrum thalictroides]|uniref:WRC domain-containing protein n=1 Tax=Thalictrum thalictroides TaxID=46969 RepID=A0A7J6X5J0_THATH|nr:hypothetical protein FRX31_006572 [Thalictrum thalictroides]